MSPLWLYDRCLVRRPVAYRSESLEETETRRRTPLRSSIRTRQSTGHNWGGQDQESSLRVWGLRERATEQVGVHVQHPVLPVAKSGSGRYSTAACIWILLRYSDYSSHTCTRTLNSLPPIINSLTLWPLLTQLESFWPLAVHLTFAGSEMGFKLIFSSFWALLRPSPKVIRFSRGAAANKQPRGFIKMGSAPF